MNTANVVSFVTVSLIIFSLWVAFALLVINPYLHSYVPGYEVGKPCGWEFVALGVSGALAYFWTRNWPRPKHTAENGVHCITISYKFVLFLLLYMIAAISIFLWEYSKFSATFN